MWFAKTSGLSMRLFFSQEIWDPHKDWKAKKRCRNYVESAKMKDYMEFACHLATTKIKQAKHRGNGHDMTDWSHSESIGQSVHVSSNFRQAWVPGRISAARRSRESVARG